MSIEDTIIGALAAQLVPLREELRRLTSEVEAVRRALPPQVVTVVEAAAALGVSVATVRRRVKDGTLRSVRLGGTIRVDLGALRPPSDVEVEAAVCHVAALTSVIR